MIPKPWLEKSWPEYVPKHIDYPEKPLYWLLEQAAEKFANYTYIIFLDQFYTYAQINDWADRFAMVLKEAGLKKGEKVALYMPNTVFFPIAFFGILKAGGVVVNCNPLYTARELQYQFNDADARFAVTLDHPKFYPNVKQIQSNTKVEKVFYCNLKYALPKVKAILGSLLGKIPMVKDKDPEHIDFWKAIMNAEPLTTREEINPKEDLAMLLYTGGTTGVPKGAMLTHMNLVANVIQTEAILWPRPQPGKEGFLGVLPWFHSYGLTTCLLMAPYIGARVIAIPDPRAGNPPFTEVLELIHKYKPTLFNGVPTLYAALLNHPHLKKYDLSSINACVSGAAPLPVELKKQWEAASGSYLVEGYGLTETSPVATVNPMKYGGKPGSIGIPVPDTELAIFDIDDKEKVLPQGETGEIGIKGPQVMKGYWKKEEETKKVFNSMGFFLTGDVGHMDEEGFFFITDRKKDMIDASGYKIYPREVEEVLFEHPAVQLAAVVGVPDPKRGETVKAFIVLKPGKTATEEEIINFCKERLAPYKVPKLVEFRNELPQSAVGKVLRRVLKEEEEKKAKAAQ